MHSSNTASTKQNAPTLGTDDESVDIFNQLSAVGLDPVYLMEIAAHDLIQQYGADALAMSRQIEVNCRDNKDRQSTIIWSRITAYMESLNGDGALVAH